MLRRENMTDDIEEKIKRLEQRITTLENKEKNRVNTPYGVYDKDSFTQIMWITIFSLLGFGIFFFWAYATESLWFEPLPTYP